MDGASAARARGTSEPGGMTGLTCRKPGDREKERSRLVRGRWALDAEIQAVKLRRGGGARIGLGLGEGDRPGPKVIQEYPQRREDAKQAVGAVGKREALPAASGRNVQR